MEISWGVLSLFYLDELMSPELSKAFILKDDEKYIEDIEPISISGIQDKEFCVV